MTVVCYSTIAAHTQAQNIIVDTTLSNIAFSSHSRNSPGARANRNVSPSMLMCLAVACTLTHRISHIQRPLNVRAPSLTSHSPLLTPGISVSLSLPCLSPVPPDPGQHQAGDLSPAGPSHRLLNTRNIITRHRIMTVNHNARTIEDFSLIRKCTY